MLCKIFVLAFLFHFGEFTNIERVLNHLSNPGSSTTYFAQAIVIFPLPLASSSGQIIQPQYNQYQPSADRPTVNERFSNNENQLPNINQLFQSSMVNADSIFVPQQNNDQQQNQPPSTYRPIYQQSQPNPSSAPISSNLHFVEEKISTTTFRSKFDRTNIMSSEESSQRTDQRPSSDSFGDEIIKKNQDETSSNYPLANAGISPDQITSNKQNIEHYNKPDENAIVIPNMPSKIIEIIFPPTLSYDEDASTTTRASIFGRRTTTTESTSSYQ